MLDTDLEFGVWQLDSELHHIFKFSNSQIPKITRFAMTSLD